MCNCDISSYFILEHLDLQQNQLEGALPESLYNLTNLGTTRLADLCGFVFRVRLLSTLFSFIVVLVVLRLNSNMFASTISDNVGMLTKLELFYIHDNFFEGTLPETLVRLGQLSESCQKVKEKRMDAIHSSHTLSFPKQNTFESVKIGFRDRFWIAWYCGQILVI